MKKHTNLYNEIEVEPDTTGDMCWMVAGVILLILALIAIVWTPDVEAIGSWIYKVIN